MRVREISLLLRCSRRYFYTSRRLLLPPYQVLTAPAETRRQRRTVRDVNAPCTETRYGPSWRGGPTHLLFGRSSSPQAFCSSVRCAADGGQRRANSERLMNEKMAKKATTAAAAVGSNGVHCLGQRKIEERRRYQQSDVGAKATATATQHRVWVYLSTI